MVLKGNSGVLKVSFYTYFKSLARLVPRMFPEAIMNGVITRFLLRSFVSGRQGGYLLLCALFSCCGTRLH